MPVHTKIVSDVVNYSYKVDGPSDHSSVLIANGSFFKDLSTGVIHQKTTGGNVVNPCKLLHEIYQNL